MQQTKTYQLNLMEPGDVFSPDPLNQNIEKVEAQFTGEAAARQSADAALDERVQALEAHKIVVGGYTGIGTSELDTRFIHLGFTPIAVLVQQPTAGFYMAVQDHPIMSNISSGSILLGIVENGFSVTNASSGGKSFDMANRPYTYLAIL